MKLKPQQSIVACMLINGYPRGEILKKLNITHAQLDGIYGELRESLRKYRRS